MWVSITLEDGEFDEASEFDISDAYHWKDQDPYVTRSLGKVHKGDGHNKLLMEFFEESIKALQKRWQCLN